MNRWKMRSSFTLLLVSYLIILCIPFLIGTYIYIETVQTIEEDALKSNMALLKQNSELLEKQLAEAERAATTLAINPNVVNFMQKQKPLSSADYFLIHEILLDMRKYDLNPLVDGYYLYFPNSELLLSSTHVFMFPKDYGEGFQMEPASYDEWENMFRYDGKDEKYYPMQQVVIQTHAASMLTFQKMIFSGYEKDPGASVIIFFREEELKRMFHSYYLKDDGWAAVLDEHGHVLFKTDEAVGKMSHVQHAVFNSNSGSLDEKVDGKREIISYLRSDATGWTYVAALPKSIVLQKANKIKTIVLTFTLISLIIGVSYALWMARKNSRPLKKLIEGVTQFISGEPASKNDYEVIQDTVSKLVTNHLDLQKSMEMQLPYLQSSFLDRLLKNGFQSNDELEAHSLLSKITLEGDYFFVVILRLMLSDTKQSRQMLLAVEHNKLLLKKITLQIKDDLIFHNLHENMLALIVPIKSRAKFAHTTIRDEAAKVIQKTANMMLQSYDIQVSAGIGRIYTNRNELWKSFNEAKEALEHTKRNQMDIVWYDQLQHDTSIYYLPYDLQLRLLNSVKAGDEKVLRSIVDQVEKCNFEDRRLTDFMLNQLLSDLNGLVIRLFEDLPAEINHIKNMFMRLERPEQLGFQVYFEKMKEVLLKICYAVSKLQQSEQKQLLMSMKQYIDNYYSDPNLSLTMIADHFQLSESYMSTFFKDHSGQTFSEYLESVRMQEACKLLRGTSIPIADIARQTGYNSDKVFRRAFKRVYQLLPTEYRKISEIDYKQALLD